MSDEHSRLDYRRDEPALNVLVLGAIYGIAVLLAVVFSPRMGLVSPSTAPGQGVAAQEAASPPARP